MFWHPLTPPDTVVVWGTEVSSVVQAKPRLGIWTGDEVFRSLSVLIVGNGLRYHFPVTY